MIWSTSFENERKALATAPRRPRRFALASVISLPGPHHSTELCFKHFWAVMGLQWAQVSKVRDAAAGSACSSGWGFISRTNEMCWLRSAPRHAGGVMKASNAAHVAPPGRSDSMPRLAEACAILRWAVVNCSLIWTAPLH